MKKNKKGDIPITLLVVGVFVVCTLALLSFISSTIKIRDSFVGIALLEEANILIEEKSLGDYEYEKVSKSIWPWSKEKVIFRITYQEPS